MVHTGSGALSRVYFSKKRKLVRLGIATLLTTSALVLAPVAQARITQIQILTRGTAFGGHSFAGVGQYEFITGIASVGERMLLRAGLGVAARYLDMNTHTSKDSFSQSTPTTVVMLGLERKLNANISFGPDLSYRSALVQDTFDKSSWDASFRLNATF